MNYFLTLLTLSTFALISCERHDFEETRKLHDEHGSAEAHGAEHGTHAEGEHKAEH